jgi:trk system potassium uptake protein TrkA
MRIIVVGCGRLGAGLAGALARRGHAVTVVDRDQAAFARLGRAFAGQRVAGEALDRAVLARAGIEQADALAAVTPSDEVNLVVTRLARQVFRVPRVVARLYDPDMAEAYRRLGVPTVDTAAWGVQRLAELLGYSELAPVLTLGDGRTDIVELTVPPLLAGRTVHDVTMPGEAHVVAITRAGRTLLPDPLTVFQTGDRLYLVVAAAAADRLKAILGLA